MIDTLTIVTCCNLVSVLHQKLSPFFLFFFGHCITTASYHRMVARTMTWLYFSKTNASKTDQDHCTPMMALNRYFADFFSDSMQTKHIIAMLYNVVLWNINVRRGKKERQILLMDQSEKANFIPIFGCMTECLTLTACLFFCLLPACWSSGRYAATTCTCGDKWKA